MNVDFARDCCVFCFSSVLHMDQYNQNGAMYLLDHYYCLAGITSNTR